MSDMYDRLGSLLRDALDSGSIREPNGSLLTKHGGIGASDAEDEGMAHEHRRNVAVYRGTEGANNKDTSLPLFRSTRRVRTVHASSVFKALNKKDAARGSVCKGGEAAEGRPVPYTAPLISAIKDEEKAAYAVLGLKCGAAAEEIKAAWRAKLKMFHPDSNSSNEVVQKVAKQKTMEVMAAYKVLMERIVNSG